MNKIRVLVVTSEWPSPEHPELAPFIKQQVQYLEKAGIDVTVFHFIGHGNPINYFFSWVKLHLLVAKAGFDIIHAHWGQSGLICLPSSVPLVVTFHGSDLHGFLNNQGRYVLQGKILQKISRFVSKRASYSIVVSAHLVEYLPDDLLIAIISGGVNLEIFKPINRSYARECLNLKDETKYILFAADPKNPIKRFSIAKSAVEELVKRGYPVELLITCDVPHEKMPLYMNACDVLIITSTHEGSPTVLKEALACGLPILTVNVGDVRQQLASIEGCVICDDSSIESLTHGLEGILSKSTRLDIGSKLFELDESKTAEKVITVYNSALSIYRKIR